MATVNNNWKQHRETQYRVESLRMFHRCWRRLLWHRWFWVPEDWKNWRTR